MSEGKEIKFKFVVDEQSAQRVNRVLDDMIKRAQDLAKTLQGVGGGGGGGIFGGVGSVGGKSPSAQSTMVKAASQTGGAATTRTSFVNVVGQNLDMLKKMGDEGSRTMKVMSDAISRGINQQRTSIGQLEGELSKLLKMYQAAELQGGNAFTGKIQERIAETTEKLGAARKEFEQLRKSQGTIEQAMAPETTPERKGFFGRMKDWAMTPGSAGAGKALYSAAGGGGLIQGVAPQGIGGWLRVGGMALAGADAAFTEARSGTRAYNEAEANRGRLMNRRIRALKGGDVSDIMALQMMGGMDKSDLAKQVSGTGAEAEATISGIKKMFSRGVGSLTAGVLGEKGGNILGGLTDAEKEQMKGENLFKQVDNFKESTQYLRRQMAMEHFEGNLGGLVGGAHLMGYSAERRRRKDGTLAPSYFDRQSDLKARGFEMAQEQAAFSEVMGVAGKEAAFRRKGEVMSATAGGYGGYGQLVGMSERLGMGNVLAQASIGGGIDKTAGIQLGQALLGTGFDVQGMTSRAGVMAAMQAGMGFTGKATDFPLVQQGMAGLQMGSAISTGQTSPYQRGANLLAAINSGAGNTYLQDYLGNQMSFEKMLDVASGADSDKTLEALGGNQEMVKKTLSGKMTASLSTLYDKGLEGTKVGDAVKRFRESGLGLDEYLQKARKGEIGQKGDVETLGIAAAQAQGQGQEAGIGLAKVLSGMNSGENLKVGQVGAGKLDDLTSARLKKEADRIKEASGEIANNFEQITEAFKASGGLEKAFESFGSNLSASAEVLHQSFTNLADAATKAAMKLNPAGNYNAPGTKPASGKATTR